MLCMFPVFDMTVLMMDATDWGGGKNVSANMI